MVAVGFNPRKMMPPQPPVAERRVMEVMGKWMAAFMRSLRDAGFVLMSDPWVETHGYHHMVAPRPGTRWRYARGVVRDGVVRVATKRDAGRAALPFHAVAERRSMVAVGFNPRKTTPPHPSRRGATG